MRIPSNVTLESFKPEHVTEMQLRAWDAKGIEYLKSTDEAVAVFMRGPGITVRVNGTILGAGGYVIPWPGRAEAWILTTPGVPLFPKLVFSLVKHYLSMASSFGFRRVETTVPVQHDVAIRWLERLGFKREGVMQYYGPNEQDCYRYVILPGRDNA